MIRRGRSEFTRMFVSSSIFILRSAQLLGNRLGRCFFFWIEDVDGIIRATGGIRCPNQLYRKKLKEMNRVRSHSRAGTGISLYWRIYRAHCERLGEGIPRSVLAASCA